jgi:hypothetical protein
MKRILLIVSAVAASLLINASYVLAAGDYLQVVSPPQGAQQQGEYLQVVSPPLGSPQKDECLLVAKNCPDEAISLQERIDKLNIEIGKGTDVYTVNELNVLQKKLDDANKSMDLIRYDRY